MAVYFGTGTRLPLWPLYTRQATLTTGLVNARTELPAVLAAVADGRLRPEVVTDLVADWDEAPSALLAPATKAVITRPRSTSSRKSHSPGTDLDDIIVRQARSATALVDAGRLDDLGDAVNREVGRLVDGCMPLGEALSTYDPEAIAAGLLAGA